MRISTKNLEDSKPDDVRRLVRWAKKSDKLRGISIEEVPTDELIEEAAWQCDPYQD